MKKQILTASLVAFVAASSFGQGQVSFKSNTAKNGVYSATDGTTASLALVPTTGTVGSFGTVSYEILTAPSTTALLTQAVTPGVTPVGWTATAVGAVAYTQAGAITLETITMPASAGAVPAPQGAAVNVDLEIVAFTGTYSSPTLFGYSGQTFATVTTANGLFSWSEPTGNPNSTPQAGTPGTIPVGSSGFGSMILVPAVPEPSTIALGGMAAAALLAFRRRK